MTAEATMIVEPNKDGSWWLGLIDARANEYAGGWIVVTWGDEGWHDSEGYPVEPVRFAALPDPQPPLTGWTPVSGVICVRPVDPNGWTDGAGNPVAVPYRWAVQIERSDGTVDEYREWWPYRTRDEAMTKASKWSRDYGLPVFVDDPQIVPASPLGLPS